MGRVWLSQGMRPTWKSERALGEEDSEGRQSDIGHFELGVVAGARIGQAGRGGAPTLDELIEAARVHATRNTCTAPKVQVTNV